jgi:hypothetical protein
MTSLAEHGAASTGPRAAQRLRAILLGPRGGGTTRRRASDAFRLGFAVVVVACPSRSCGPTPPWNWASFMR